MTSVNARASPEYVSLQDARLVEMTFIILTSASIMKLLGKNIYNLCTKLSILIAVMFKSVTFHGQQL